MAIPYIHPDTGEAVNKEPWHWVAAFADGSELRQFEFSARGAVFHPWKEVKARHAELVELRLVNQVLPAIIVPVPEGAVPKHFYRNFQQIPGDGTWVRYYFVGYVLNGHYTLAVVTDKNEVILTHDPDLVSWRLESTE